MIGLRCVVFTCLAAVLGLAQHSAAYPYRNFHPDEFYEEATDVILAEAAAGDPSSATVVQVLKGRLKVGQPLEIPDLDWFSTRKHRRILANPKSLYRIFDGDSGFDEYVEFDRIILFLVRDGEGFSGVSRRGNVRDSIAWFGTDYVYALGQERNPGPVEILPYRKTQEFEEQLRAIRNEPKETEQRIPPALRCSRSPSLAPNSLLSRARVRCRRRLRKFRSRPGCGRSAADLGVAPMPLRARRQ